MPAVGLVLPIRMFNKKFRSKYTDSNVDYARVDPAGITLFEGKTPVNFVAPDFETGEERLLQVVYDAERKAYIVEIGIKVGHDGNYPLSLVFDLTEVYLIGPRFNGARGVDGEVNPADFQELNAENIAAMLEGCKPTDKLPVLLAAVIEKAQERLRELGTAESLEALKALEKSTVHFYRVGDRYWFMTDEDGQVVFVTATHTDGALHFNDSTLAHMETAQDVSIFSMLDAALGSMEFEQEGLSVFEKLQLFLEGVQTKDGDEEYKKVRHHVAAAFEELTKIVIHEALAATQKGIDHSGIDRLTELVMIATKPAFEDATADRLLAHQRPVARKQKKATDGYEPAYRILAEEVVNHYTQDMLFNDYALRFIGAALIREMDVATFLEDKRFDALSPQLKQDIINKADELVPPSVQTSLRKYIDKAIESVGRETWRKDMPYQDEGVGAFFANLGRLVLEHSTGGGKQYMITIGRMLYHYKEALSNGLPKSKSAIIIPADGNMKDMVLDSFLRTGSTNIHIAFVREDLRVYVYKPEAITMSLKEAEEAGFENMLEEVTDVNLGENFDIVVMTRHTWETIAGKHEEIAAEKAGLFKGYLDQFKPSVNHGNNRVIYDDAHLALLEAGTVRSAVVTLSDLTDVNYERVKTFCELLLNVILPEVELRGPQLEGATGNHEQSALQWETRRIPRANVEYNEAAVNKAVKDEIMEVVKKWAHSVDKDLQKGNPGLYHEVERAIEIAIYNMRAGETADFYKIFDFVRIAGMEEGKGTVVSHIEEGEQIPYILEDDGMMRFVGRSYEGNSFEGREVRFYTATKDSVIARLESRSYDTIGRPHDRLYIITEDNMTNIDYRIADGQGESRPTHVHSSRIQAAITAIRVGAQLETVMSHYVRVRGETTDIYSIARSLDRDLSKAVGQMMLATATPVEGPLAILGFTQDDRLVLSAMDMTQLERVTPVIVGNRIHHLAEAAIDDLIDELSKPLDEQKLHIGATNSCWWSVRVTILAVGEGDYARKALSRLQEFVNGKDIEVIMANGDDAVIKTNTLEEVSQLIQKKYAGPTGSGHLVVVLNKLGDGSNLLKLKSGMPYAARIIRIDSKQTRSAVSDIQLVGRSGDYRVDPNNNLMRAPGSLKVYIARSAIWPVHAEKIAQIEREFDDILSEIEAGVPQYRLHQLKNRLREKAAIRDELLRQFAHDRMIVEDFHATIRAARQLSGVQDTEEFKVGGRSVRAQQANQRASAKEVAQLNKKLEETLGGLEAGGAAVSSQAVEEVVQSGRNKASPQVASPDWGKYVPAEVAEALQNVPHDSEVANFIKSLFEDYNRDEENYEQHAAFVAQILSYILDVNKGFVTFDPLGRISDISADGRALLTAFADHKTKASAAGSASGNGKSAINMAEILDAAIKEVVTQSRAAVIDQMTSGTPWATALPMDDEQFKRDLHAIALTPDNAPHKTIGRIAFALLKYIRRARNRKFDRLNEQQLADLYATFRTLVSIKKAKQKKFEQDGEYAYAVAMSAAVSKPLGGIAQSMGDESGWKRLFGLIRSFFVLPFALSPSISPRVVEWRYEANKWFKAWGHFITPFNKLWNAAPASSSVSPQVVQWRHTANKWVKTWGYIFTPFSKLWNATSARVVQGSVSDAKPVRVVTSVMRPLFGLAELLLKAPKPFARY